MTRTVRSKALLAFGTVVAAYAAYPYITLYRLGDAIRRGDAAALESLVDWEGVREGIKEDVCDLVLAPEPTEQVAQNHADDASLPPFGFSFVRGIAANVIDQNVTPAGLVSATQRAQAVDASGERASQTEEARANPRIAWAFFDAPGSFSVELLPPGEPTPIRLQMELRHGKWKVTRAWLPPAMLVQANSRT